MAISQCLLVCADAGSRSQSFRNLPESLKNGHHIQGSRQACKLPNPDTGRSEKKQQHSASMSYDLDQVELQSLCEWQLRLAACCFSYVFMGNGLEAPRRNRGCPAALPNLGCLALRPWPPSRLPPRLGIGLPPARSSARGKGLRVAARLAVAQDPSVAPAATVFFLGPKIFNAISTRFAMYVSRRFRGLFRQVSKLRVGHFRAHPDVPLDRFHKISLC